MGVPTPEEMTMGRLDGKVAMITGAASGIGAACADRFAREGAAIVGLDLAPPSGEAWEAVAQGAPAVSAHGADVTNEPAIEAAVEEVVRKHGKIDVLVNAAGVSGVGAAHELSVEDWDRVVDVNLKGSFIVAKHALKPMMAAGSGSIVHVASVEGFEGPPQSARLQRLEGRGRTHDPKHGDRLRAAWDSRELPLPGGHRYADAGRLAGRPADSRPDEKVPRPRSIWSPRGGGRGRALPRVGGCVVRHRPSSSGRWRLDRRPSSRLPRRLDVAAPREFDRHRGRALLSQGEVWFRRHPRVTVERPARGTLSSAGDTGARRGRKTTVVRSTEGGMAVALLSG